MRTGTALVTGGSAGIGLAIAAMLVDEGWSVTIVGRDEDKLNDAAASVGQRANVHTVAANLAQDVAADVVSKHLGHHDGMDLLVNNAGVGLVGPLEERPPKSIDLEISLNLRSAIRLIQESLPALRTSAQNRGASRVVNISSMVARETPPYASVYSATKAALTALSRSLHSELSPQGIHVTALTPGLVDTPGTSWAPENTRGSMVQASDVAEAVRFLLRTSARCFVPELPLTSVGAGMHELVDWNQYA